MKSMFRKIILISLTIIALLFSAVNSIYADDSAGIYGQGSNNNLTSEDLRKGNITLDNIPIMIVSIVEYLLAIAGSVSIAALIYHAFRMQLASGITGDSSGVDKAKKGIYGSILGFVLSMSAWFLMTRLVDLLATTTK